MNLNDPKCYLSSLYLPFALISSYGGKPNLTRIYRIDLNRIQLTNILNQLEYTLMLGIC